MFSPLTLTLSVKVSKNGDVYNPTLYPLSFNIVDMNEHVDPLPLVPATCIILRLS